MFHKHKWLYMKLEIIWFCELSNSSNKINTGPFKNFLAFKIAHILKFWLKIKNISWNKSQKNIKN